MHVIKKAARKEAWYHNNSEENRTYNIFGRINTRPKKPHDEENTLYHTATENAANSPIAQRRRSEAQDENSAFAGPQKAETFPSGPTVNRGLVGDDSVTGEPTSSEDISKNSTDVTPPKEQVGMVDQSIGGDNKPRKRRLRKFWKPNEEKSESDELKHTDTHDSKKKKKYPKLTFMSQFKAVFGSWINILLVMVPVGIGLANSGVNKVVVFIVNFIAIIPLAAVLSYATEELALYIGEVLGGLLNATFGNAVELIVGVIALSQRKMLIVQTSLIGSMLSNLLLVMGMCFFFGGLRRVEQHFNVIVAQTGASLLGLAVGSLIIPTAFKIFASNNKGVAPMSRGTAVLLLFTYGCYLLFQLRTHAEIFNAPSEKSPKKPSKRKQQGEVSKGLATIGAGSGAAYAGGQVNQENLVQEEEDEEETPQLTRAGALITLAGSTVFVALCAEYMVSSIDAISGSVSQEFIGLILLPIVGNAAEHATAVTVAIKDKMDLAIGVAVGSSLQIALLVLPLMVMLNWWGVGAPSPMTLAFDGFQVVVLFIAVIVVNYLIQDGKSHWLEGVLLQVTYMIIAIAAWFYPVTTNLGG